MIVVDTSVWVDLFRGTSTPQVILLEQLLEEDAGIALTDIVLTEILQASPPTNRSSVSTNG